MSERRRHLLVLLIVLGLIAGSVIVAFVPGTKKDTKLGLDLQGGVQLVYQGKPTKQTQVTAESLQRALDIMRDRVDAFGVAEPELARTGEDQIEVNLPGVDDAERAARQVGSTAQLFFYDWEQNVLDENCRTNDTEINGGQSPVTGLYNAVKRASKCEIKVPENSHGGGRLALLRVRQGLQEAVQQRPPGRVARRGARRPERRRQGEGRGHRGQARRARPARGEGVGRRARPRRLLDHPRRPGPVRHGHQEPGAELRPAAAATSRTSRSTSTTAAARRSRRSPRASPSAAPTTPTRSTRTRSRTRSTSRSRSTTSSSRSR